MSEPFLLKPTEIAHVSDWAPLESLSHHKRFATTQRQCSAGICKWGMYLGGDLRRCDFARIGIGGLMGNKMQAGSIALLPCLGQQRVFGEYPSMPVENKTEERTRIFCDQVKLDTFTVPSRDGEHSVERDRARRAP